MPKVENLARGRNSQDSKPLNEVSLTQEEIQRLLTITSDLLAICARASGRIDPAVGAMIAYARDEVLESTIKKSN